VTSKLVFNMRKLSGRHFWPDDISILDDALIDVQKLLIPAKLLTATCLLLHSLMEDFWQLSTGVSQSPP
jgi:hypothetical protein